VLVEVNILSRITPSYLMLINKGITLSPFNSLMLEKFEASKCDCVSCQQYCSAFERNNNSKAVEMWNDSSSLIQ